MKKIAIVTPELAGLYKNGGIGTNYFYRARFLHGHLNYQITILYTGTCSPSQAQQWREQYGQTGIQLEVLPELPLRKGWDAFHQLAVAVHRRLETESWDEIHLPEYLANGFVCIQAKRAGLAYQNTRLVVTMHSSSLWCREGGQQWSANPETDAKLDYAEQYCCENADTLITGSRFLLKWAENRGWRLPPDRHVLPHLYEIPDYENPAAPHNPRHLIFFGRLQTLKGLGIFCEAIGRLAKTGQAPARVDFLGKTATHEDLRADQYIRQTSLQWLGTTIEIHADFDSFEAMRHLRRTGGLAVIASLRDNLPFTVVECILNEVPFIASNAGGIPELADPRVLFAPDARSLAAKLEEFCKRPPAMKFNHPYRLETARAAWKTFAATPFVVAPSPAVAHAAPRISVCVPYYNHGKYLPSALASLDRQTFEHFEVIVVDDGSTDAGARETFANLKQKFPEPRFRFFYTENAGIGAARNFAVAQSTGDWLVFMDADNVATPEMLEVFAQAMQVSGADCATCHFAIFRDEAELRKPPVETNSPLGQCLEAGWQGNIFGDANFIVMKKVFAALGGFATDRSAVEDWQFLVRLALRGFRQIVIPENLYWYRFLPDSMMRTADEARFTRIILETYREGLSSWTGRIIENHVFGPFAGGRTITTHTRATLTNRRPTGAQGRRAKFVNKFQKSCVKRLLELAEFVSRL
jgi:glycosyltransferase involved in cell wall biosynthesis